MAYFLDVNYLFRSDFELNLNLANHHSIKDGYFTGLHWIHSSCWAWLDLVEISGCATTELLMSASLHAKRTSFYFLVCFPRRNMFLLLSAVLLRSELHLVCHQHWQHWPERRLGSRWGNLSVPPPQGVHAGHRQPVERVGPGRQQPAERDQHCHLCGAGLHPQTGRSLGPLACSTPQHLCWWETALLLGSHLHFFSFRLYRVLIPTFSSPIQAYKMTHNDQHILFSVTSR